ncbi:unnamed protein product, partial [Mesorhabditis belari]|uniref:Thiamine transporter 1 n=1 Tax=Mesorhabditis belari TaxID=2138241 RepID=A0AAF3FRX5_9BILA
MRWWVITLLLCTYGVLKEFRPSEPFLYQYEHVTLNISAEILESKVYPIWTYSYMAFLVPVFLLTDLLLYKPIIILEALSYITVWMLFVLARSVLVQQLIEVFYGWATATEIAYFAYIYVKVDKSHYKKVTSYTRAALQAGKCVAYVLAQILIGTDAASYRALNVISLVSLWIALVFSLILPAVPWRLAYEKLMELQDQDEKKKAPIEIPTLQDELGKRVVDPSGPAHPEATYKNYVKAHFSRWIKEIRQIYSELFVVKWSLWWAMASCAQFQVKCKEKSYFQIIYC